VTDLAPGEFILTLGDAHLYSNHTDQARSQLTREPRPLPKMRLNPGVRSIFEFRYEDFGWKTTTRIPISRRRWRYEDFESIPPRFRHAISSVLNTSTRRSRPPGQSDPETLSFDEYEITPARSFNGVVFWYFLEGAEYEMVPGQWTFRALINGNPVAEKTFTVSR
jgi:hypothetical protein